MSEISSTDTAFTAIENLERRKTKIALIILVCVCAATFGIGFSAFSYMMYSQKYRRETARLGNA
jgi:TRAP-type C4-dicarboxylate transport system permease small subunit